MKETSIFLNIQCHVFVSDCLIQKSPYGNFCGDNLFTPRVLGVYMAIFVGTISLLLKYGGYICARISGIIHGAFYNTHVTC